MTNIQRKEAEKQIMGDAVMLNKHIQRLMYDIQIEGLSGVPDADIEYLREVLATEIDKIGSCWCVRYAIDEEQ